VLAPSLPVVVGRAVAAATLSLLALANVAPSQAVASSLTTIYTFPHGVCGVVAGPGGALYGATNSTIYELAPDARDDRRLSRRALRRDQ
jgi:hypothetical protein